MGGYESLLVIQVILMMIQTAAILFALSIVYKLGNLMIHLLIKEILDKDD